ncbi:MAG TPA: molybdopterin molybdenumtransferase MoeA [Gammaproteobacteria bacterium]|nr:molybdopterin molybdenumtransferase MoeA [Gammaproteobacteria bacterium]
MNKLDAIRHTASCADATEPGLLSVEQAEQQIFDLLRPLRCIQRVDIRSALGRTLADDVHSTINVPPHVNSAMDGYAIRAADIPTDGTTQLTLAGSALAGTPFTGRVKTGQCVRIMTGAKLPDGCDTVIMQEQAEVEADCIRIDARHRAGENVRQAGEDLLLGQTALPAGKRLQAADLGLLASMGMGEVNVTRSLRVAFFSTGDELRSVGSQLAEGEIYDSNRYSLHGMLQRQDVELIDMGVIADHPDALKAAFENAAQIADVIITTGGVSVGDADYVKTMVAELGEVNFWKLAIKPGRPMAFGTLGDALFFGLPGNPVAVMVTFYQFVQPALRYLLGQKELRPFRFQVNCASAIRKRPGRTEYQRGQLGIAADGRLQVSLTGAQGSGILSSMSAANCFIVLAADQGSIAAGDPVTVEPFEGLF